MGWAAAPHPWHRRGAGRPHGLLLGRFAAISEDSLREPLQMLLRRADTPNRADPRGLPHRPCPCTVCTGSCLSGVARSPAMGDYPTPPAAPYIPPLMARPCRLHGVRTGLSRCTRERPSHVRLRYGCRVPHGRFVVKGFCKQFTNIMPAGRGASTRTPRAHAITGRDRQRASAPSYPTPSKLHAHAITGRGYEGTRHPRIPALSRGTPDGSATVLPRPVR